MYSVAGKLLVQVFTVMIRKLDESLGLEYTEKVVRIKVLVVSLCAMFLIILIGCGITTRNDMENLSFHSSMYFWFVSLTTIGYGDIHFDRNKHLQSPHLLLLSAGNLLFGLGIVAAIIESFALALEKVDLTSIDVNGDSQENAKEAPTKQYKNILKIARNTNMVANSVASGAIALDLHNNSANGGQRPSTVSNVLLQNGYAYENCSPTSLGIIEENNPMNDDLEIVNFRDSGFNSSVNGSIQRFENGDKER